MYRYSDSFGYTGVHDSVQPAELDYVMQGPGLHDAGQGLYQVTVPRDGEVRFRTRLTTLRPDKTAKGCLPALLRWLRKLLGGRG